MDTPLGPILLVEDDESQAVLIRSLFEHSSLGAVIRIASTGQEALDYLEGVPPYDDRAENPLPEVIILDLGLPVMKGLDLLRWLFVSNEHSDIPVIVFTASTDPEDERMAYSLGVLAYKSKPEDFGELVDIVRGIVDKSVRPNNLSLENNDIGHVS